MLNEIIAEENTEEVHVAPKRVNVPVHIVDSLMEEIVNFVHAYKNFTPSLVVRVVPRLMGIVERYRDFTGEQKKSLVLHVLLRFANETLGEDMYQAEILSAIETIVPAIIDTLVAVDLKQIRIKARKRLSRCF